jgi:hypothetical protein
MIMPRSSGRRGPAEPDYYVYVVENVRQGDPAKFTLWVLGGARLQRLLGRAIEYRGYSVPWPVADYDSCPVGLGGLGHNAHRTISGYPH